jgi:phage-related minor tail protein
MKSKFEKEVLLSIKREFSKDEKQAILMQNYREMEEMTIKHKEQITHLQEVNRIYKKQYADLQNKYVNLCKKYNTEEYEIPEKL